MMPANVRHHPSDFINKNNIGNKAALIHRDTDYLMKLQHYVLLSKCSFNYFTKDLMYAWAVVQVRSL